MSKLPLPFKCPKIANTHFLKRDLCDRKRAMSKEELELKFYNYKGFCFECVGPEQTIANLTTNEVKNILPASINTKDRCSVCDVEIGPMTKTGKCQKHAHERNNRNKQKQTTWSGASNKDHRFDKRISMRQYGFEIIRMYKAGMFWWIEYVDNNNKVVNKSTGTRTNKERVNYLEQLKDSHLKNSKDISLPCKIDTVKRKTQNHKKNNEGEIIMEEKKESNIGVIVQTMRDMVISLSRDREEITENIRALEQCIEIFTKEKHA